MLPSGAWTQRAFPLNIPGWSLFIEILCNVLHGAIFSKLSSMQSLVIAVAVALVFVTCYTNGLSSWGLPITAIIWLIPRELSCYLVGIWIFRFYGDAPLGRSPMLAVTGFAVALVLASINPFLQILVLVACPFLIRASLGLGRAPWTTWAGAISYPLYATHVPVLQVARAFGLHPAIGVVLMAAVALLVTVTFELRRPARMPVEAIPG